MKFGAWQKSWLVLTAFVCGATIMVLEVLGARMLSVGYGGSMMVWAAMIAVTLLSLAAGYYLGGCLADRIGRASGLYGMLLVAALLSAFCPLAGPLLRWCYDHLGLQGGALVSSLVVFFLPLSLLGMTSPYIIGLLGRDSRHVGATAGTIYAVSTLGSVLGTLATALWMIPALGTPASFKLVGMALVLLSAFGLMLDVGVRGATALLVAGGVCALPQVGAKVGLAYIAPDGEPVKVIAVRDSAHGHMVVLEKAHYRLLVVDGIVQTGIPLDVAAIAKSDGLRNHYYQELIPYLVDDPARANVLVIGLAGGMTASLLMKYEMSVDCVDLDPAIIQLARDYFQFKGDAVAADGRRYLEQCEKLYDFCVMDTYSGDRFPFYLAGVEVFRAARNVLKPGGVVVMNFIGAPTGQAFAALYKTLGQVFPHLRAIRGEHGDDVQTITVFASDNEVIFNRAWLDIIGDFTGVDPISEAIADLSVTPDISQAPILTDRYNPIDFMRADEALRWRQRTAENIGKQTFF